jgi:hypothetical protein
MMSAQHTIGFWSWFFKGSGSKPGFRRLMNRWMIFHVLVGSSLAYIVKVDISIAANTVLLPLVGILIGLCFAWAGNAQALLQSNELRKMSKYSKGGFAEYVYIYQTAILAILVTLVFWALAGFKIFDDTWPTTIRRIPYLITKSVLFTLSSLTLRECWHVVLGSQWMLLIQHSISQLDHKDGDR